MSIPMVSTGAHRYEGVWLKGGDPFEALNDRDADELQCTGFARRVAAGTYMRRDMVAAEPAAVLAEPPRQKRAYTRRDAAAK
jgi:hypothetical protein